jgi:pyridoxal phosphate enzyme (YggS family)
VDAQTLQDNIARVQERIAAAEQRAGRPGQVTLVAVSKTHPAETVLQAHRAGLTIFGENRVEEAGPKAEEVARLLGAQTFGVLRQPSWLETPKVSSMPGVSAPPRESKTSEVFETSEVSVDPRGARPPEWHMIGHLQSRKAGEVLPWASLVHSVDTVKLARRLSRVIPEGQVLPILLEVNVSGEETKAGFRPRELPTAVEAIAALPGLGVEGLMTMAPIVEQAEEARRVFRALRQLRDELAARFPSLPWTHLSMGMTDDFEVAIEEGATLVRIGRALFGER